MSTPSPELVELCGAVRDEVATPEQIARLEALLAADREARRFYRGFLQITATLERYERAPTGCESSSSSTVPADSRRWTPRGLNRWLALAACLAVLGVVYVQWQTAVPQPAAGGAARSGAAPIALIQQANSGTLIPRAGTPAPLRGNAPLGEGDIVATAANGGAVLRFAAEQTLVVFSGNTRAWLSREGPIKIVHLTSGQMYCDVAPQKDGAQWRILTADGEARIVGTQLAVSTHAEGTRVAVTAGRVRVTARDSRQSVETRAGFAAELTPTTARLVRLEPSEPTRVASFTAVDADTNAPLPGFESLADGAILDLARLPTRRINIRANCEPRLVGAVRFALSGTDSAGAPLNLVLPIAHSFPNQIEIYFPYMLAGDPSFEGEPLPAYSYAWVPLPGRYTLTATPYATMRESGARGETLTVHFQVVDGEGRAERSR